MRLIIISSLLLLIISGCLAPQTSRYQNQPSASRKQEITQVIINNQTVWIEIARSEEERMQGLSNRNHIAADQGMLFVFPNYAVRSFWMKEMQFPLDIIWIKDDRVVGVVYSASTTIPLTPYHSPQAINYVLEVNAGWTKTFSVASGDRVEFR